MPRLARPLPREVTSVPALGARHLFLVLTCDSPAAPSLRVSLKGVERVFIGRGGLEPRQAPVARRADGELTLSVADDRMSTTHAAIRSVFGNWIIEDAGSRNGTLVNGRPVKREVLADGDLIELGHTFFVFRADVALPAGAPPILDTGDLRPAATGVGTLLPSLAADLARAVAVSRSAIPVVIRGETGTGKELVASAIHALSGRQGPFLAVNCGGLSPSLVQSELLGHCKGAFTGAIEDTQGIVRSAQGGTLFLDGIEDLPLGAQPLLLRVLEQAEVVPVGTTRPVKVDVRVVVATQRDLGALAAEQRFRSDLLARLSGLMLHLPPLRERREDLE